MIGNKYSLQINDTEIIAFGWLGLKQYYFEGIIRSEDISYNDEDCSWLALPHVIHFFN